MAYYDIMGWSLKMDIKTLHDEKLPLYFRIGALVRLSTFVDLVYEGEEDFQQ